MAQLVLQSLPLFPYIAPFQSLSGGKRGKRKKPSKTGPAFVSKASGSRPQVVTIDHTHLVHGHHKAILSGLALCGRRLFWKEGAKGHILIVGLGGGAFPMYLHKCLLQV